MPMPVLRIKSGTNTGKIYDLADANMVIGRDRSGEFQILDQGVSRKHAEIFRIGELFFLRDLESRNGTFVNSEKVSEVVLRYGNQIQIGNTVVVFEDRLARFQDSQEILTADESQDAPNPSSTLQISLSDTMLGPGAGAADTEVSPEGRRLSALLGISHVIGSERDLSKIITKAASQLGKVVDADNVFVFLLKDSSNGSAKFDLLGRFDRSDDSRETGVSSTIIHDCLEQSRAVLTSDAGVDARYNSMASVVLNRIRSVICVPIAGLSENLGILYISNGRRPEAFTSEDLELASAVSVQLATTIQLLQVINRSEEVFRNSIRTLVSAIEMKDPFHKGRAERLASMCLGIAKEIGWSTKKCRNAWLAGMLFDIGSIPLTDRDREAKFSLDPRKNMYASKLLQEMPGLEDVLPAILQQKERWDGSGSPESIKGDAIHPLAQVLGIAFEFDEYLQSGGPQDKPLTEKEALVKIMGLEDRQFSKDMIHGLLMAFQNDSLFDQDDRFFELPI
jgi:pSer/pThr/pTyr-binding forkhead associated (FHA) protein